MYGIYKGFYHNIAYMITIPSFLLIFSSTGMFLAKITNTSVRTIDYYESIDIHDDLGEISTCIILFIFILSVGFCFIYLKNTGFAFIELISRSEDLKIDDLNVMRNLLTTRFRTEELNLFGYFSGIFRGVLPVCSLVVFLQLLKHRKSIIHICLFALIFFFTSFMLISTLIKSDVVKYVFMLFIAYNFYRIRLPKKIIASIFGLFFLFFVLCLYLQLSLSPHTAASGAGDVYLRSFYGVLKRLTITYNDLLHLTFETFPAKIDYIPQARVEPKIKRVHNWLAENELGWVPTTSLEDGITRCAEWWKSIGEDEKAEEYWI